MRLVPFLIALRNHLPLFPTRACGGGGSNVSLGLLNRTACLLHVLLRDPYYIYERLSSHLCITIGLFFRPSTFTSRSFIPSFFHPFISHFIMFCNLLFKKDRFKFRTCIFSNIIEHPCFSYNPPFVRNNSHLTFNIRSRPYPFRYLTPTRDNSSSSASGPRSRRCVISV